MAYEYREYGTAGRCLHKADGATKTVFNDEEKAAALADGWSLSPVINGHVIDFDEAIPDAPVEDAPKKSKKAKTH